MLQGFQVLKELKVLKGHKVLYQAQQGFKEPKVQVQVLKVLKVLKVLQVLKEPKAQIKELKEPKVDKDQQGT